MTKVVYNNTYGGFSLSKEACERLDLDIYGGGRNISRTDPGLISLIEQIGPERCSGRAAKLAVKSIPDIWEGCWKCNEYDGAELIVFDGEKWLKNKLKWIGSEIPDAAELVQTIINIYDRIDNE